jgi:hypothetical protein
MNLNSKPDDKRGSRQIELTRFVLFDQHTSTAHEEALKKLSGN